jgi:hypothetical protein
VTRAVVYTLDPSRTQERLAYSYAGARRFAYNWAIGVVRENLKIRSAEREAGVAESDLPPSLSLGGLQPEHVIERSERGSRALVARGVHARLPIRRC